MDVISSRENQRIKEYIRLRDDRSQRESTGCFVTEGDKLTEEALAAGCVPEQLFVREEKQAQYAGESVCVVTKTVAEKLRFGKSDQGVFGIFRQPPPAQIHIHAQGRYLILHHVQDPGNVGTMLRTSSAMGLDGVFLSEDCAHVWSLKTLRASMGGAFRVPWNQYEKFEALREELHIKGIRLHAAALDEKAVMLSGEAFSKGGHGVVIGNEGRGLPWEICALCDDAVMIPMKQGTESLNAAGAAAILCWELGKR